MPWPYNVNPSVSLQHRRQNAQRTFIPIPDPCKRRAMNYRAYLKHIASCTKPECREVLRNHVSLCESFGIEFHPPH